MTSPPHFGPNRGLQLDAWIGMHPDNHRDVAHLLLSPLSVAISEEMPRVAELLGLAPTSRAPADVPSETARITVSDDVVHVLFGVEGDLYRPVNPEWSRAAHDQGVVMLTCGTTPFGEGTLADLDLYLAGPENLFLGLLQVTDDGHTAASADVGVLGSGLAGLAAMMPVTEEDMIRKMELSEPVQRFFRQQAEPGRSYSMADIGSQTGIGPEDAVALMHCLTMLVEIGLLRNGPPAGAAGPTWQRT